MLPIVDARHFWQRELQLVGKMLSLDSRNFHGWGYRRRIVAELENLLLKVVESHAGLIEDEFKYTTKMINTDLSNFSAWHNRSKLIPRLLYQRNADDAARREFLESGKIAGSVFVRFQTYTKQNCN